MDAGATYMQDISHGPDYHVELFFIVTRTIRPHSFPG